MKKRKYKKEILFFSIFGLVILLFFIISWRIGGWTYKVTKIDERHIPAQNLKIVSVVAKTEVDGNYSESEVNQDTIDSIKEFPFDVTITFEDGSTKDWSLDSVNQLKQPSFQVGAVINRMIPQNIVTYTYSKYNTDGKLINNNLKFESVNPNDIQRNIVNKRLNNKPTYLSKDNPIVETYQLVSPGVSFGKIIVTKTHKERYGMYGKYTKTVTDNNIVIDVK